VGAYWARDLADGGIRRHELSQRVIQGFWRRARSVHDFRGNGEAPPAGFEPAHTAPEGAAQEDADQHQYQQRTNSGRVEGAKPWARGAEVADADRPFCGVHPRQASADDDAGKCRNGDPS
jgi:hypothetical protein